MRGVPVKRAALLLFGALTLASCSQTARGVRLDAPSGLAEVVVIHYAPPPRFFVTQPRSVGRAMAGGAAVALFALPFGPLAPIVGGEMAKALQASMERTEAEAVGERLAMELALEDPVTRVKEGLIAGLTVKGTVGRIRAAATAMESDDIRSLKRALGRATVLDVKTLGWGLRRVADPEIFIVFYRVRARIIRLDSETILAHAERTCIFFGDRRYGAPTLDDLKAEGGRLLKAALAQAAEQCVEPTLARLRGQEEPQRAASPLPLEVTLDPSTLTEAEARLLGHGGLIAGSAKFDAKFKGLALTVQDLPKVRSLLDEATASPWGSEVQFRGTIDGAPFRAKMDKGNLGRVAFGFAGLRFDDEGQARDFLAPLQKRGVRQVKLKGWASGRPVTIELTPAPAWSAASEAERPPVEGPATRAASARALAAARPPVSPGNLAWPPAGSSYVLSEQTSGSYGSGRRRLTVRYLGEQTWRGERVHAFSEGSLISYVDARRRLRARVNDGMPVESFQPYLVFADWPLSVGKWWPIRYRHIDHASGRTFDDVRYDGSVEAYGDVVTPSGIFKAFRIVLTSRSSETVLWYSTDLALVVKMRIERFPNHYLGAGIRHTELVSHDFKP